MTAYTFDQIINFTRTSAATYVANTGFVTQTPASRNLLTYTQEFDNAAWTKLNTVVSGVNAAAAPDGTLTADLVREAPATLVVYSTGQNFSYASGSAYTFAVYLKKGSGATAPDWMQLTFGSAAFGTSQYANFNLATGAVGTVAGGFASIQSAGNGWYRCAFTATATATATTTASVVFCNNSNASGRAPLYTGATTSDVFIWGAQLEAVPDANLVLGSELVSNGAIGLVGTATAATYNTGTGVGTVSRVDTSNQSFVQWTGLTDTASYRFSVTNTGASNVIVRSGNQSASVIRTVTPGETAVFYGSPVSGRITITAGADGVTSSFTLNSFRQITGTTGMPTTYTRNVGGVYPPRFDYDPVTLAPRGLLIEEQRTNFLIGSADFTNATAWAIDSGIVLTANADTAPTGTAVACQVAFGAGSRQLWSMALGSPPTGTLTASIYIKGTAGETIKFGLVGDEGIYTLDGTWQRLTRTSSTYTAARVTVNTYSGVTARTVLVWGAQLEAGAFATSYIPTVASQVTRTADQAAVTGANFSRWYNQSEGTLLVEYSRYQNVDFGVAAEIKPTSVNTPDRFDLLATSAADPRAQLFPGGSVALDSTSTFGVLAANTIVKAALAYRSGDSAATRNGASPFTSATTFSAPSYTNLQIGNSDNGIYGPAATNPLNGHIRRIRYYPTRLSNAQLQALTA